MPCPPPGDLPYPGIQACLDSCIGKWVFCFVLLPLVPPGKRKVNPGIASGVRLNWPGSNQFPPTRNHILFQGIFPTQGSNLLLLSLLALAGGFFKPLIHLSFNQKCNLTSDVFSESFIPDPRLARNKTYSIENEMGQKTRSCPKDLFSILVFKRLGGLG